MMNGSIRQGVFEQERVLVRLQQRVLQQADIRVCYLSGSFGRGTHDAYSDLDVALVFADEERRDAAYEQRRFFVQSVLPYVPAKSFDAEHVRPFFHVALYSNGAKVDYRYETQDRVEPSPWDREIRLLKDSGGWGERFQEAAAALPPTIPKQTISAKALEAIDERFWVMFMDVLRLLLRGDAVKAFPIYLQVTYFTLPEILRLLPEEDTAHLALIEADYSQDTGVTVDHMRRLLDNYLAARAAVVRRHMLAFTANGTFEEALRKRINGL